MEHRRQCQFKILVRADYGEKNLDAHINLGEQSGEESLTRLCNFFYIGKELQGKDQFILARIWVIFCLKLFCVTLNTERCP